jgi:predicted nuclease with TOPRIM domain
MRKTVKEALNKIGNFGDYKGILKKSMVCKEAYEVIKNELKWLDHKTEYISKLEEQVDELEIENFDLKERIEQLEGKYETEGYDDSRY